MIFNDNKAIYLQIAEHICDDILNGTYPPDERIPSVREYAAMVEVNANTVMRSYDYLQSNGILYNKRGIGYFVDPKGLTRTKKLRKDTFIKGEADYFFKQFYSLGISPEELAAMYHQYIQNQQS
ncbi:transcriptional regulator, GntR family [gut metagenome]|uniref:Transcriptional regulator, GntR family n=1 Tax=gut metagenome TaxID=749906 RepID=J9CCI5_9ZZZZ